MKTEKDIFNKKQQPENIQSYQVFSVLSLTERNNAGSTSPATYFSPDSSSND